MIYEFAVDPSAVNNWQRFRYIYDQCGVEHGRLISRFPHKWRKMVIAACVSEGVERIKIVERLLFVVIAKRADHPIRSPLISAIGAEEKSFSNLFFQ